MSAGQEKPPSSRLLDVSEDDWTEAVRRQDKVRALAAAGVNSKAAINAAADALGLSGAQIYRLIERFRRTPITASLVITKPGPKREPVFFLD